MPIRETVPSSRKVSLARLRRAYHPSTAVGRGPVAAHILHGKDNMIGSSLLSQVVTTTTNGNGIFAGVGCFGGIIGLLMLVLWIWALVDLLSRKSMDGTSRIVWILVIIFLPLLGSILWFLIGRKQ